MLIDGPAIPGCKPIDTLSKNRITNDPSFLNKYFSCNVEIEAAHTTL